MAQWAAALEAGELNENLSYVNKLTTQRVPYLPELLGAKQAGEQPDGAGNAAALNKGAALCLP